MRKILVGLVLLLTICSSLSAQQVGAGIGHSVILKRNGQLWAWGLNTDDQLGMGTSAPDNLYLPAQIGTDNDWRVLAVGARHNMAIKTDGSLWGWGYNQEFQLGTGNTDVQPIPVRISEEDWKMAAAGDEHTLVLNNNNELYVTGSNQYGQLGFTAGGASESLILIEFPNRFKAIAAGEGHSLLIRENGTLWAAGLNDAGQLGIGSLTNADVFTQVGSDSDWDTVAANGKMSMALKANGDLYTWGQHDLGQLGLGTKNADVRSPEKVNSSLPFIYIATSGAHSFGIKSNNTLWAFGNNLAGQLGINSGASTVDVPTQVGLEDNFVLVAAGDVHSISYRTTATVCSAGDNSQGQLGNPRLNDESRVFACQLEGALPVTFLEFNGKLQGANTLLTWKTANEVGNQGFDVERSTDGGSFQKIGSVAAGNGQGDQSYNFTDRNVTALGTGAVYYRLRQNDLSGSFSYSSVVTVLLNKVSLMKLYPNPVKDQAGLSITLASRDDASWQVRDLGGRLLLQGVLRLNTGTTNVSLDVSRLSKGVYFLTVQGQLLNEQVRMVKQ